jgi:hypothetical protein
MCSIEQTTEKWLEPLKNKARISLETKCVWLGPVKLPRSIPTLACADSKMSVFGSVFPPTNLRSIGGCRIQPKCRLGKTVRMGVTVLGRFGLSGFAKRFAKKRDFLSNSCF